MLQAQAKGMFCSSCDAPSGMNCKRWEPHRGFDVGFVIHGQDLGDDGTKETLRFEEALSPESREHCHCGVVGGYIENDARSWGSIFCLLVDGRMGCVRSWCAQLVRLGIEGDGGKAGIIKEKIVESLVNGGGDANDVAWHW